MSDMNRLHVQQLNAQQQHLQQHHPHVSQQQQQQHGQQGGLQQQQQQGQQQVQHQINLGQGNLGGSQQIAPGLGGGSSLDKEKIFQLVLELLVPEQREQALLVLSKNRDSVPDLAPVLWHSFGTMSALLQEIISIYPDLSPPNLTAHASNRVCNALALLQCVASHADTRTLFMHAHMPLYLYPFLNTNSKNRPFEFLRLTSLGVIGALVKTDETAVITFLLTTEIIPLCLRIMETGSELSKTVATFIVQKILLDDMGLQYICHTYERFSHVALILGKMVHGLAKQQSQRLLKHVVRCYLRLSDNARAREALRQCLPEPLKHATFANCLREDQTTKRWLTTLLQNLGPEAQLQQGPNTGGPMLQSLMFDANGAPPPTSMNSVA
eukprot:m.36154 g.36154  ORF g.36154 m.36154 type:complete len:382 (+) comp17269_c2_seq1:121-1266(+)